MRRISLIVFSLGLMLAGAVPFGRAETPATQDSVQLTFGWPEDLRGQVTYSFKKEKTLKGNTQVQALTGTYEIWTAPSAEGMIVSIGNVEVKAGGNTPAVGIQAQLEKFFLRIAGSSPNYVIGRKGEYIRLEGLDTYQQNIMEGMDELLAGLPPQVRQQISLMVRQLLSKEQLEKGIVESWNREVGAWAGAAFDRGDLYQAEFTNSLPLLGNMEVPMVVSFHFLGRVPCSEDETEKNCVDLEMETTVNAEALSGAFESLVERVAGAPDAPLRVDSFDLTETVRLTTEPDTLIPHRLASRKVSTVVMSQGGELQDASEVEETLTVYRY